MQKSVPRERELDPEWGSRDGGDPKTQSWGSQSRTSSRSCPPPGVPRALMHGRRGTQLDRGYREGRCRHRGGWG